jgi:hypothetical protein
VAPEPHQSEYRIKAQKRPEYNMMYFVNIESENLKAPEGQNHRKWTSSFTCDACRKNLRDEPWGYVCREDNSDLCGACATERREKNNDLRNVDYERTYIPVKVSWINALNLKEIDKLFKSKDGIIIAGSDSESKPKVF